MVVTILVNTPIWVYVLFVVLLVFGWLQTKDRSVGRVRAFMVPVAFLLFSAFSVLTTFGVSVLVAILWLAGLILSAAIGFALSSGPSTGYDQASGEFQVAGSWAPLVGILGIFLIKYSVGILAAFEVSALKLPVVVMGLSFIYGILGGVFGYRTIHLLRAIKLV